MAKMAAEYKRFCRITSRIKDDHISQSRSKINTVFDREIKPDSNESKHAILIYKKLQKEKIIAVYVPDIFAAELFRSYKDKTIKNQILLSCWLDGSSRAGVEPRQWWKIPSRYEISKVK